MPNSNQSSTKPSRPRNLNIAFIVIGILGFLGFADSAYLTADHYFSLPLPCYITHGCETVLTSKYAMVGPVPLAVLGVVYYLTVLFLALYIITSEETSKKLIWAMMGITTIGFLASILFIYIQIFLIGAICMYCAGSALSSTLLFITSVFMVRSASKASIA